MTAIERFLKYVTFDTQSDETTGTTPSTEKQMEFAKYLKAELEDLGLNPEDVGIKGSPTYVSKAFRPAAKDTQCQYCSTVEELAEKIKLCGGLNG